MNTIYYFAWLIFYQLAAITSFVVFFDVRSDFALFDFFDHKAFTDAGFPPETHLWFAIVAISGFIINWLILMRIYVIDPEAKKTLTCRISTVLVIAIFLALLVILRQRIVINIVYGELVCANTMISYRVMTKKC